ncbi:ABC transporter permease [Spirochaeta lutea]|uniref:ABC transmembrane type-2 domain-containing protein n=1 Tax=Spirochaeta lutea TaxID=1480694 RepID=A0A098QY59_9SPIO|nr:ABC transporter permease [Spirochaeta lutea]KGE71417.1 hypothetical protein DC28_11525 [Spirochaeta lutea]
MKHFSAMVKARTMEFLRDRGTFFWNLLFPIVLVAGFAFAFSGGEDTLFTVGTLRQDTSAQTDVGVPQAMEDFLDIPQIEVIKYDGQKTADELVELVRQHQLDMAVDFQTREYFINDQSANGPILRRLLAGIQGDSNASAIQFNEQAVSGEPIRYVDWLVPGVIGMNMMFSCLFGVGFVIVRYRKNGVLKRLKATPVSAFSFVSAQMASRLLIVVVTSIVVYTGTNLFLGFTMRGSYLNLLLITMLGVVAMISLGLIFAARIKSEELASGLMNLITFPMIIFSGVFFSLEGTPQILQNAAVIFPLTHFIQGARSIMLEGAGLPQLIPNILYLLGFTGVSLAISSALFKWE